MTLKRSYFSLAAVTAADIYELFGGDAEYRERVARGSQEIRVRQNDGVHLTRSAASWVADIVLDRFADIWEFAG